MISRVLGLYLALICFFLPSPVLAAERAPLELSPLSVAPFAALLLAIALLPLFAAHFWHHNRNRALVAALLALPVVAYLVYVQRATGQDTLGTLRHELVNYVSFVLLLGSLYTVSGGIVLRGDLRATPLNNVLFLAAGALLSNLIGTTGASVLLIRPLVRVNRQRRHTSHLILFFIFIVSNVSGLLTPLGDPPLFLGYLNGVPFTWTLALWPQWLLANGLLLSVFFVWDTSAYRRETPAALDLDATQIVPLRLDGSFNVLLLAGIMAGVLVPGLLPGPVGTIISGALMLLMAALSWGLTPTALRQANAFTWGPILEVAILFAGIFITMVPALELLAVHGPDFGITQPWQFFWLTGLLSGFLDNAPTYLTFATLAAGPAGYAGLIGDTIPGLEGPRVLAAVSCGAVFMGALSYIGNGPNFMVKAIADESGFQTPSFFGYLAYSCAILLPVFVLITFVFFAP